MHIGISGLVLVLLVLLGLDYYVFRGIKKLAARASWKIRKVVFGAYWGFTLLFPVSLLCFLAGWFLGFEKTGRNFVFAMFVLNYFPKVVFSLFVLFNDVAGVVNRRKKKDEKQDDCTDELAKQKVTRSEFILGLGVLVATIPTVATGVGIVSGVYDYRIRRRTIVLPNLPKAFDGIRIAQLSDIHSGSFYNKKAVMGGIEMLNAEKPDVVFFTGDLVNDRAEEVVDYLPILDKIRADFGVYSVLGNHDYGDYVKWTANAKQRNLNDLKQAHRQMGWKLLLDEHTSLKADGDQLGIIGVENWGTGTFAKYGNLEKAVKNAEYEAKILLSHDPSHWDAQVRTMASDIDLTLSGHTHGMQFGVELGDYRWSPVKYRYKQWADLYTEGNQHLYVNRGFGFIGFPGRIGILPEITILELKRS